ncbi:MAG: polysaccharide pyruvyl transferase family protein [Anaerolineaceae bacterium]|nr:polysaccharide pyruvyl transferase family protein [Anaerolineaceae bacterium]
MDRSPTIAIIGGTIWGNRGAESMLTTTIGMINRIFPGAHFIIFSYYPVMDRQLVRDERITILSGKPISLATRHFIGAMIRAAMRLVGAKLPEGKFFKIARALSISDVLLDIGGITFSDGREKFLPFNILTIWPAMLLGVPVVKMAQAVGPFRKLINRFFAKIFLKRCCYIFARGEKTEAYLKDLKYPKEKTSTSADIAFLYKPEFSLTSENENTANTLVEKLKNVRAAGKSVVVLSPSVLVEKQSRQIGLDYIGVFLDAVNTLGTAAYHFVVVPNATREGSEKVHNNDLLVINAMKNRASEALLSVELIDWVDYDVNTAGIRRIIQQADVLVTSRYHAMIAGLCLSVPTLVIGWSHKYRETMAYFGLAEYALDFSRDDVHIAISIIDMLNKKQDIKTKIKKSLPVVRRMSELQFKYITQVLK